MKKQKEKNKRYQVIILIVVIVVLISLAVFFVLNSRKSESNSYVSGNEIVLDMSKIQEGTEVKKGSFTFTVDSINGDEVTVRSNAPLTKVKSSGTINLNDKLYSFTVRKGEQIKLAHSATDSVSFTFIVE